MNMEQLARWFDISSLIRAEINAHFPAEEEQRQWLAAMEEAGELIGAYRRWQGLARRVGSKDEFLLEFCDVTITNLIWLQIKGITVFEVPSLPNHAVGWNVATLLATVSMDAASLDVLHAHYVCQTFAMLNRVQELLSISDAEVEAAMAKKIDKIFERGWKDDASSTSS